MGVMGVVEEEATGRKRGFFMGEGSGVGIADQKSSSRPSANIFNSAAFIV